MNRLAPLAGLAVAAVAALPATPALAAPKPKAGTYVMQPAQKGVKGSRLSLGVDAQGRITAIGFFWTCGSSKKTDHQTTFDLSEKPVAPRNGAFKASANDVYTVVGELPDIEAVEAKVAVTGKVASAKAISGTIVASVGKCSTGTLKYTVRWEGPPRTAPSA